MRTARAVALLLVLVVWPTVAPAEQLPDGSARLDRIFARWNSRDKPGCAVAVSRGGKIILSRAYGMADLEHDVPNSPDTVFEAGSVSKQFTAGAILMLAFEGKLSLDDNVRKYVPELPDYGTPITLRHLVNHSSGVRDWGSLYGIAGWPRTTRVYTPAYVLDIMSRQRALNFPPGSEFSYSNAGFSLLAVIVGRVSGISFAEFTRRNFFAPLGMTHTQWRDDFKRVVKGRAVAYDQKDEGGFAMDMPFENVCGNGGLLTTVGDLLLWTENLETGKVGGPAFLEMMHRQGTLNNGKQLTYASGLFIISYKGTPEISHRGSTAGYRAFLARFPKQHLAVAVLANVNNIDPGYTGHKVIDLFLGTAAEVPEKPATLPAAELSAKAGWYRHPVTGEPLHLVFADGALRLDRVGVLVPLSANVFRVGETERDLTFEPSPGSAQPHFRNTQPGQEAIVYEPNPEYAPPAAELAACAGEYSSPELETTLTAIVEAGKLILRRRPDTRDPLTPLAPETFAGSLGLVRFIRDQRGEVTQLSVRADQVYDLRFDRVRK